jgi:ribonuclease Y
MSTIISIVISLIGGSLLGIGISKFIFPKKLDESEEIEFASTKAQKILLKAKEEAQKIIHQANKSILEKERKLGEWEKRLFVKHQNLERRETELDRKEDELDKLKENIDQVKKSLKAVKENLDQRMQEISGISKEEAKSIILNELEEELAQEKANRIREAKDQISKRVDEIAKELIISTMQTVATEYTGEMTTTTIPLENEEIKGRIIGRDGRNIKTFEKMTGVDVILDESPDYITLSCFDPIRREIARIAMVRLIADGRIHPGRIEEYVSKAKQQVAKEIIRAGEDLAFKAGFPNLPLKAIKYLGKYYYRFSYGQNLASHTLEVVKICGKLAAELGLNVQLAKKCALFHDLGKVAPAAEEGGHPELGVELGKKLGLEEPVLNAMLAHHGKADPTTFESALTAIGDAISGSRPGARRISAELYIKRITDIENIAKSFKGVKEAYAIYAGRELRVLVEPEEVDDAGIAKLSHEIAKKIEKTQTYPGTIQVTVIRESRATDMAK